MARILLTNTTERDRRGLRAELERHGHEVTMIGEGGGVLAELRSGGYDVVFIDVTLTVADPVDVVGFARESTPETELVVMSEVDQLQVAASCIRRGASLYLVEPVDPSAAVTVVEKVVERRKNALVVRDADHRSLEGFFGVSAAMNKLLKLLHKVAPTDATLLVTGESGTGKEVVANIIHRLSPRARTGELVTVNCGAIPEALLESELFGHVRGSFTGATHDKKGLLEVADGGTCFLDEIGDMPPLLQVKLLRFLQDRMVRRVGGLKSEKVDVRVIAATNKLLVDEIAAGRFREDLFFRLNVVQIFLPPLRERKETIPFLSASFVQRYSSRYRKRIQRVSPEAQAILMAYDYPGNIRELENTIEHACIMAEDDSIEVQDLPPSLLSPRGRLALPPAFPERPGATPAEQAGQLEPRTLAQVEADHIRATLEACGGNQTLAARQLGISRTSLWRKMKALEEDSGKKGPGE